MDYYIYIFWIVWGIVGYLIGKEKNRAVEGALWGFFLGLIGIVIIVLRSTKPLEEKKKEEVINE
jgi:uncharacterized membrane protein HdeD (DUF308 family)